MIAADTSSMVAFLAGDNGDDVELIQSGRHPSGLGEPSSTVVAPAVANAIYNAVGVRVRHMPITPDAILEGLKSKA